MHKLKKQELEKLSSNLSKSKKSNAELEKACASLKDGLLERNNDLEKMRDEMKVIADKSLSFEVKVKSLEDQNDIDINNIKVLKQAKKVL